MKEREGSEGKWGRKGWWADGEDHLRELTSRFAICFVRNHRTATIFLNFLKSGMNFEIKKIKIFVRYGCQISIERDASKARCFYFCTGYFFIFFLFFPKSVGYEFFLFFLFC